MKRIVNKVKGILSSLRNKQKAQCALNELTDFLSVRGVLLLYVELPSSDKIKGLSEFEKERLNNWSFDFNKYKEELPKLKKLYGDNVTQEYILSVFDGGVVVQGARRKVLLDFSSDNQHIINGRRLTVGQPSKYHNTIYTHGACTWRGTGVEDKETIASFLQNAINIKYPNSYRVINSGIGRGSNLYDDIAFIKEQDYMPGDIVILGPFGVNVSKDFFKKKDIAYIETSQLFDRPHIYGEWFNDSTLHTNKRGNKVIADYLFNQIDGLKWLKTYNSTKSSDENKKKPDADAETLRKGTKIYGDNPELLKYIDSIRPYLRGNKNAINGSIVMNCNPFTLGHRYLIEYAAQQVETLYIFVVEENRSYFPFQERLELVKKGTEDISNVVVLPSGNFIISATTFPGYFYKDNLKDVKIDCSNDINVFAQYIAPALNIRIRFAGEEPLDPVTNQYNEGMRDILPKYGMEFRVIERKKDDNGSQVISASRVRKLYEAGEFESLKKLVPNTTLSYLIELSSSKSRND